MAIKSSKQDTVLRYVMFCSLNIQGCSDKQIARRLEFKSPEALYQRLSEDGFPVCAVCGETPIVDPHCEKPPAKPKRKVRTSGEAIELPPAKAARPLFRKALELLSKSVEPPPRSLPKSQDFMDTQFVDELGQLKEYRQGALFVSALVEEQHLDKSRVYRREDFTPEEWEELCEHFQVSPSVEVVSEGRSIIPNSAESVPADTLVKLIGAYILADEPLEPLVDVLHPEPETADWQEINKQIYGYETTRHMDGMMDYLRRAVKAIRGAKNPSGPKDGLTREELADAWDIMRYQEEGLTREQIYEKFRRRHGRDYVDRLGKLRPKYPD